MNEEEKIIEEQFKTLPTELQVAVNAVPWKSLTKEIALLKNLSPEQTENFERETMFILYGFENPRDYITNIVREVKLDEAVATAIADEVGEKILKVIEDKAGEEESGAAGETNLIENLHDENSAENIRNILKANSGEDREKLIENQFKKLPEALQEAIQIVPWRSVVKEIALLNKLDLSQIVAVERETMFVIYGFEDEKNYLANIMKEAKLEEPVAVSITKALNDRVFRVIVNKVGNAKPMPKNIPAATPIKIQTDIHPMVEPAFAQGSVMVKKGEVAHEVPHVEQPTEFKEIKKEKPPEQPKKEAVIPPVSHYPSGKDPYREPIV